MNDCLKETTKPCFNSSKAPLNFSLALINLKKFEFCIAYSISANIRAFAVIVNWKYEYWVDVKAKIIRDDVASHCPFIQ